MYHFARSATIWATVDVATKVVVLTRCLYGRITLIALSLVAVVFLRHAGVAWADVDRDAAAQNYVASLH